MGRHGKKKKRKASRFSPTPERINTNIDELKAILDRAKAVLSEKESEKLHGALDTLFFLTTELGKKRVGIQRLKDMLFGASTEKAKQVLDGLLKAAENDSETPKDEQDEEKKKKKGHGRNGADAYTGAEKTKVSHDSLKEGDDCPICFKGTLYKSVPGLIVNVMGQAPLKAKVYEIEKLRCNLCGTICTAKTPEGVKDEKYDAESAAMIALLKYGSGLPFNRLGRLQGNLGIPLPASTQWDIVSKASEPLRAAHEELIWQAAQGEVLHNDDTAMKILGITEDDFKEGRSGVFTTGIVSVAGEREVALFFTGTNHAGENLTKVLKKRASELGDPIQMCDALSRNLPEELKTIVANCLTHGRRKFVEVVGSFPDEVVHVITELGKVYHNDALARNSKMTKEERLSFHKEKSGPVMDKLDEWMTEKIEERKVEPNSSLGGAIGYMQKHWKKLTLFLTVAGAPLDNNIAERSLKKVILNRKNAYFYKTKNGARVGDLYMSLIHTCELNKANPFEYLTELQKQATDVAAHPERWMPWNYDKTLAELGASALATSPDRRS